jgi:hypothetical protein
MHRFWADPSPKLKAPSLPSFSKYAGHGFIHHKVRYTAGSLKFDLAGQRTETV